MGLYDLAFTSVLTRVDAERAHRMSFGALRGLGRVPGLAGAVRSRALADDPALAVTVFGRTLRNPLGLAAGFDKNAEGIDELAALGFGFVEIGTVTGLPQPGNDRPRLFRLPADRAIVNRMGFNNEGAAAVARRLAARAVSPRRSDVVLGVNIGKSKVVPMAQAAEDYAMSAQALAPFADYLVVNVSSPNTPGLRDLQAVDSLRPILEATRAAADTSAGRPVPLLVKIAPDLADDDVVAVAGLVTELDLSGVVATNTTISRTGLRSTPEQIGRIGTGGVSGPVLRERSEAVLRLLRATLRDDAVVISVGGVGDAQDVCRRLELGATLVQAYAALVYSGPLWVRRTTTDLARARTQEAR